MRVVTARLCLKVIIDEADGSHSLDWLHRDFGGSRLGDWQDWLTEIGNTCSRELNAAVARNDDKLTQRWRRTAEYVVSAKARIDYRRASPS
jgi:hypothetical protein